MNNEQPSAQINQEFTARPEQSLKRIRAQLAETTLNHEQMLQILDGERGELWQRALETTLDIDTSVGDWRDRARCSSADPDSFFPEQGRQSNYVMKVCDGCSVRDECRREGDKDTDQKGVWGGTSEYQRRVGRSIKKAS